MRWSRQKRGEEKYEMKEPFPFPPLFAVDRRVLFGWRRLARPTNPAARRIKKKGFCYIWYRSAAIFPRRDRLNRNLCLYELVRRWIGVDVQTFWHRESAGIDHKVVLLIGPIRCVEFDSSELAVVAVIEDHPQAVSNHLHPLLFSEKFYYTKKCSIAKLLNRIRQSFR